MSHSQEVTFSSSVIKIHQLSQKDEIQTIGGIFASVGQLGMGFGTRVKFPNPNHYTKYVSGLQLKLGPESVKEEEKSTILKKKKKNKRGDLRVKLEIGNESLKRLMSGGIAGAVSRSAVAPLETIKTHLMVGTCGKSALQVFDSIIENDGWRGLYRGNLVNVIRVAPSKAIELFAYDTVKKHFTPKPGEESKIPLPPSLVAGAVAGFSSTLCTYPLELLKTRLTVQRGVYKNFLHAITKIIADEGVSELYRGLVPSLIGVMPYAAANYYAYDTLRKTYKRVFNKDEIGNLTTLLMGSAAAVASSSATFPLEVARKQMQAGAVNGRHYRNLLHALLSIVEREGISGLYRGLGASCVKVVPAAGISFMCYEACKRIMIENKEDI